MRRKYETMFDIDFLKATLERAVKTFIQTLLAVLGTDQIGLLDMDWVATLTLAGSAALLSVITSLSSAGVGKSGPSLVGETTKPEVVEVVKTVPAARKPAAKKAAPKK
jgi:hypothetical protein